jgi:3-oxoacyl-[acyl-carrier protein] reductase
MTAGAKVAIVGGRRRPRRGAAALGNGAQGFGCDVAESGTGGLGGGGGGKGPGADLHPGEQCRPDRDNLLLRLSDEDWSAVLEANLTGAFHTTRAVIKGMMKRRAGRIINITSVVGLPATRAGQLCRQQGRTHRVHQVGGAGIRQPQRTRQLHRPGVH